MTPDEIALEAVTRMAYGIKHSTNSEGWKELREHVDWQICAGDTVRASEYACVMWALRQERAACALACENEHVDAEDTQAEGDFIYNRACDDCAEAIRGRGKG